MERGVKRNGTVMLCINVDGEGTKVGNTSLFNPADEASSTLLRHMLNQLFDSDEGCDHIATHALVRMDDIKSHE